VQCWGSRGIIKKTRESEHERDVGCKGEKMEPQRKVRKRDKWEGIDREELSGK